MRIGAEGIVTNHLNEALFVLRDDSRTWALPGGSAEAGELPDKTAIREVEEETGLRVVPVRLVGLYHRADPPDGSLVFCFRCIQKGGQLAESTESPSVGFMKATPPPRPMLELHQQRLHKAITHAGGPPHWAHEQLSLPLRLAMKTVYGLKDIGRTLRGQPAYQPPPELTVGVFVVIEDDHGRVLWVKRRDHAVWNLPGGACEELEAPWDAAMRETKEETGLSVRLTDLSGVYLKPQANTLVLVFTGERTGGALQPGEEAAEFAYYAPGQEPPNTLPKHIDRVADALGPWDKTLFRIQDQPASDLEELAQRAESGEETS